MVSYVGRVMCGAKCVVRNEARRGERDTMDGRANESEQGCSERRIAWCAGVYLRVCVYVFMCAYGFIYAWVCVWLRVRMELWRRYQFLGEEDVLVVLLAAEQRPVQHEQLRLAEVPLCAWCLLCGAVPRR